MPYSSTKGRAARSFKRLVQRASKLKCIVPRRGGKKRSRKGSPRRKRPTVRPESSRAIEEEMTDLQERFDRNKRLYETVREEGSDLDRRMESVERDFERRKRHLERSLRCERSAAPRAAVPRNNNNKIPEAKQHRGYTRNQACSCAARRQGKAVHSNWQTVPTDRPYVVWNAAYGSGYGGDCDGIGYDGHMSCIPAS